MAEEKNTDSGTAVIYTSDDGARFDVQLKDETVWLTQASIADLFQTTVPNISMHIRNIYQEGELPAEPTVKKFLTVRRESKREVKRQLDHYNLDIILSVGYRVKSSVATQFRIWATKLLKDHLVKGFTLNQQRLAHKGLDEARQVLSLLANTLENHDLVNAEGRSVLGIISKYAETWKLLLQYDEGSLPMPAAGRDTRVHLDPATARRAIASLKQELYGRGEATTLFGGEKGSHLEGILGAIDQTFGGHDLYPTLEQKAAHLLYFIIKDHPFTDGNKRIGSFLFIMFLQLHDMLDTVRFDNKALVALTLLTAASDPSQKDVLIRLIVNLLSENTSG